MNLGNAIALDMIAGARVLPRLDTNVPPVVRVHTFEPAAPVVVSAPVATRPKLSPHRTWGRGHVELLPAIIAALAEGPLTRDTLRTALGGSQAAMHDGLEKLLATRRIERLGSRREYFYALAGAEVDPALTVAGCAPCMLKIVATLKGGAATLPELVAATGVKRQSLQTLLWKLLNRKVIMRDGLRGAFRYTLAKDVA